MTWVRIGLVAGCLLAAVACGKGTDEQIRESVRTFDRARLKDNQVTVENVQPMGDFATAEVTVRTAVKMKRVEGRWEIEEFRVGDRQWVKADDFLAALDQVRAAAAKTDLRQIAEAIREYRKANSELPGAEEFPALIDSLTPDYLSEVIRIDPWWTPYRYQPLGNDYDLRSAGADGRFETPDDIVAEKK